jgi:hypothetical protein
MLWFLRVLLKVQLCRMYVWGKPGETIKIAYNGLPIVVSANWREVLDRVQIGDRARIIWVNVIYIDRENLLERNWYVAFMGKIYEHAKRFWFFLSRIQIGAPVTWQY